MYKSTRKIIFYGRYLNTYRDLYILSNKLVVLLVFFLSFHVLIQGVTITSTSVGGDWDTDSTWIGGVVPAATDSVIIATTGEFYVAGSDNGITYTAACLTINDEATLIMNRPLVVTGSTTIGDGNSGYIYFSSATNINIDFIGIVYLNPGSNWIENTINTFTFNSGIVNLSGNIYADSGMHTFSMNPQPIEGVISFPNVTVNGIILYNFGTFSVSNSLTGTGQLINTETGTFNIGGTSSISAFIANIPGNTVNYNGVTQSIFPVNYFNLTLSGSGVKTFQPGTDTIKSTLTINGAIANLVSGTTISADSLILNVSAQIPGTWGSTASEATNQNNTFFSASTGMVSVGYGSCIAGTWLGTSSTDWNDPSNWCGGIPVETSNVIIPSGGNQPVIGVKGGVCNNITINNGASLTISGSNNLTVSGNWINSGGTFTPGTGTVIFNGTIQTIGGTISSTFNNLNISNGGTKSLQVNVYVSDTLNLLSGVLKLGSCNLTLTGTTGVNAITGIFSNTDMIETNGTGMLIFTNTNLTGTGLNGIYPVGNAGTSGNPDYNPVVISGLTGAGANRTLSIGVVSGQLFVNGINRYWLISQSGVTGSPALSFTYLSSEASSDYTKYQLYTNISGSWALAPNASEAGLTPVTSELTAALPASGEWTASVPGAFYSYQSGNWNNPTTWTNDPSGTTLINPVNNFPGDLDAVNILPGRTVTLTANVTSASNILTINGGGFLNLSLYKFTNSILSLGGQGTLQISPANPVTGYFPVVNSNTFINAGGGTVEYDVSTNLPASPLTYNNLTVNSPSGTDTMVSNLNLNGSLWIEQGIFQINGNTANVRLQLTINGNVTVNKGASLTVGTGNTTTTTVPAGITTTFAGPFINYYDDESHRIVVNGNFTNNGTVRFTNQTYPTFNAFPTTGIATVYFRGSANNTLTCNGTTDFYNLVLDKGTNQNFQLTVYSSAFNNFRLFGANTAVYDTFVNASNANPNLKKALWIRNGTLNLTGLITIPSLTEGNTATATTGVPSGDYFIPSNGAVILNDPFVTILSTADDYTEVNAAYGLSGGSNTLYEINSSGAGSGLSVLGKLQVDNGYLSTRESSGILYWSYAPGQFIINGGTVDTKQFHNPEGGNTGLISFSQTGGNIIFRGRFQNTINYNTVASLTTPVLNIARNLNGTDPSTGTGTLSINGNTGNGVAMSGGNMFFYDVCGTSSPTNVLYIGCPISNINVTGGTIQVIPTTGTGLADANYLINTVAPIGNLTVNQVSGTSTVQLNINPVTILQNLNLQSGTFDANLLNVDIGGNFFIASGTNYLCTGASANRTIFNGTAKQTFTVNQDSPLALYSLIIDKSASGALVFAGTQNIVNIYDSLMILNGKLGDNGNVINVSGGVYNAGIEYGTGKIAMSGTNIQTIDGNGSGIFNNLDIHNTNSAPSPVLLTASITVNGLLNLVSNKIFNIGTYNLLISSTGLITSSAGFSNSCYIMGSGNSGDGGITQVFNSNTPLLFPLGCFSTNRVSTPAYTPATIGFVTSPSSYGSVTVIPVGYEDPTTTVKGQSLTFFWKVISSGFGGSYTVSHNFVYSPLDVNGNISNYVPSLYNTANYTWNSGLPGNINTSTNTISDWSSPSNSSNFLEANYTAGDNTTGAGAFGTSVIFYSISGNSLNPAPWESGTTWSHISGGPAIGGASISGVSYPGPKDIVIIENNNYVILSQNDSCASLQIQSGSTLDIYYYTGSVFSIVQSAPSGNNGLFRLTTPVATYYLTEFSFPGNSDFSDFNNHHGTTEYYDIDGTAGNLYILPANVTSYGNLMVTAKGGDNLVLPNNSLTTINGNLTCGGDNPNAWIAVSWNTNIGPYWSEAYDPTVEKTIHVTGNLNVNNGTFIFMPENVPQHFIVDGSFTVGENAYVYVQPPTYGVPDGPPVTNTISIGDSFINNSTGSPFVTLSVSNGNTYYCNLIFQGSGDAFISGTSPYTILNNVTINKGNSETTSLTCNLAGSLNTPVDNWLTLQNGTFIYNSPNDFNISTVTPFTIPSTGGLTINTPNNIYIANANSNLNTMYLNGKLTLSASNTGNVYIGPVSAPDNNNDIEYSSGGNSAIEADGGSLVVNGAIRRNPSDVAGVLKYTQTGSCSVTINGNNALNNRAKFEVLNNGSIFNMTGNSVLNIIRGGGGNSFGDLYIKPQTGTVNGGTIIFGPGSSLGSVQNYQVDANIPLNNITITGFDASDSAKVQLMIDSLIVNGDLTLSNPYSILNTLSASNNSIDVNFNGNLINNGKVSSYIFGTNLTTFSASNSSTYNGLQSITGSTINFYNLIVNAGTSLTLCGNTTVANDLCINTGTLICGSYKVNVSGNFTNNGNYTDNVTNSSGIGLAGTSTQHVSGTGSFGWLELNNTSGAILNNDITLNENLTMTNGILNIQQYLLTLQQNSTIDPNITPFSNNKMVTTNGVLGNNGINKFFTTIPQSFVYPIGTSGKYTPATIDISASGYVGSVRINNINSTQPTVLDPSNALKYYWDIQSSGISGFQGSLTLHYLSEDVAGGPDSLYKTAWLISPGTSWSINSGIVYPTPGDSLQIYYPSGTENLSGEYTAGINSAFPDSVPSYTSNKNGNWNDPAIWTQTTGTTHPLSTGPNGFIVIIKSNDTVDASTNYCSAYETAINGNLVVNAGTFGHNFGTVSGNGTLTLQGGTFPAGNYTTFLSCLSGGTVEYGGTGDYTIIADLYNNIPNILFTGTGRRILPDKALTICNSFIIGKGNDNPVVDNSVYNQHLTITGTIQYYSGTFKSGTGTNATVTFAGSSAQTIGGVIGNFTGNNAFNNFEINNSAGLSINPGGAIVVNGNLLFTNGLINTSVNNTLTITNTDINCVIPSGGSNTSYVNGPLSKIINQGDDFAFPIGQGILPGNRIKVSATQTGPLLWTAQYFNPNPTSGSYAFPLSVVSWNEYWSVTPALPSQADIILTYYPNSDIIPLVTLEGLPALKVANYYAGQWNELPSIASGTNFNGTVSTTALVAIPSSPENYTMAVITSIIPKAKLSPTGAICGQTGIPVTFSAPVSIPFNYILYYTINDTPQDPVTITPTMLPYVLPTYFTGSSAVYMLTGFTYNNGADTGVADPTPVTAYANPTAANAGYSQSVCGITSVRLSGNNPAPYTGIWSIVSGTGGTVITPNNPVSQFNGILPNSYTLQWTINNGSCESTSDVAIAFTTRPSPPVALPSQNLCDGATISEINVSASTGIVSWYTSSTYPPVSTALTSSTLLTTGTIYYADAVSGTCISTSPLTPVIVTLEPPPSTTAIHHDE